jgi:hypothetical protein
MIDRKRQSDSPGRARLFGRHKWERARRARSRINVKKNKDKARTKAEQINDSHLKVDHFLVDINGNARGTPAHGDDKTATTAPTRVVDAVWM